MARSGPVTKDTSTIALGLAQIRIGSVAANIATISPILTADDSIGVLANTKYVGNTDWYKLESGFPLLEDLTLPIREAAALECAFKELTPFNLALAYGVDPLADVSATIAEVDFVSSNGTTTGNLAVDDTGGVENDTYTVVFTTATTASVYGVDNGHVGDMADLTSAFEPDNGGHPYFSIPANYFSGTWAADDTYVFKTTAYVAGTIAYSSAHAGTINLGARTAPDYVRMEAVYTYPNGTNHLYIVFPRVQVSGTTELDLQSEDAAAVPVVFEAKRADSEITGGNAVWDTAPLGKISWD